MGLLNELSKMSDGELLEALPAFLDATDKSIEQLQAEDTVLKACVTVLLLHVGRNNPVIFDDILRLLNLASEAAKELPERRLIFEAAKQHVMDLKQHFV